MNIFKRFLRKPTFVVDAWTLRDFYAELVKSPCEEIFYVTGVKLGNLRVLSRICPLDYEVQSPVYVRATRKSSVNALIPMHRHGNQLHLVAHPHPGVGPLATLPSLTDLQFQGQLQKTGAHAIALIVSRDGYLRFWTVSLPFKLIITGQGVSTHKQYPHVYHLDEMEIPQAGREQRRATAGPALLGF